MKSLDNIKVALELVVTVIVPVAFVVGMVSLLVLGPFHVIMTQ